MIVRADYKQQMLVSGYWILDEEIPAKPPLNIQHQASSIQHRFISKP